MHLVPTIFRFGAVALVLTFLPFSACATEDFVLVKLADGVNVRAVFDKRTDQERLWLTTSLGDGSLSQSIPWEEVTQVEIGGQSFEGRIVRAAVATLRDASPSRHEAAPPGLIRLDAETTGSDSWESADSRASRSRTSASPKIEAMTVSAWLANWDQDVAVDGLAVELTAYDSYGDPVPCDGTVNFVIQAWKTSGRNRHLEVRPERWTRTVTADEFRSGSVFFRLPFRAIEPHGSSAWWPHGVLQIRLAVPGIGGGRADPN